MAHAVRTRSPAGRRIPDPGFAGDDGSADPAWPRPWRRTTRTRRATSTSSWRSRRTRLLVPVVAVLGEVEVDDAGLAHDKTSDMATVLLTGQDGRQALLAFTSLDDARRLARRRASGARWRPPLAARVGAAGGRRGARGRRRRADDVRRRGRACSPGWPGAGRWPSTRDGPAVAGRRSAAGCEPAAERYGIGTCPRELLPLSPTDRARAMHHGARSVRQVEAHSHPHRPRHQVVGSGPHRGCDACRRTRGAPRASARRAGALVVSEASRGGHPAVRPMEDTSAPSYASTTGSGYPRSGSSDPTARPSASSPRARPSSSPRKPTSTSSRSPRWASPRSASSWTTGSSSTRTPRRPVRPAGTRRT